MYNNVFNIKYKPRVRKEKKTQNKLLEKQKQYMKTQI